MKQVIVMRTDLGMRKGKMIAQGSHASLKIFLDRIVPTECSNSYQLTLTDEMKEWMMGNYKKICVGVPSEEELMDIFEQAKEKDLPVVLITDSGLTEFKGVPTNTCLCIGPSHEALIDEITGHLKLL